MTWIDALDAARITVGKEPTGKEPSSKWKHQMLLAEHSPIRLVHIKYTWKMLKYWISVHLVRHNIGVTHFVCTQRSDRTGINRDEKRQDSPVTHMIHLNAQACISISKARLCFKASPETRNAWLELLNSIKDSEPELHSVCVKSCVYSGFCPEIKSCGYTKTDDYLLDLEEYRGNK